MFEPIHVNVDCVQRACDADHGDLASTMGGRTLIKAMLQKVWRRSSLDLTGKTDVFLKRRRSSLLYAQSMSIDICFDDLVVGCFALCLASCFCVALVVGLPCIQVCGKLWAAATREASLSVPRSEDISMSSIASLGENVHKQ